MKLVSAELGLYAQACSSQGGWEQSWASLCCLFLVPSDQPRIRCKSRRALPSSPRLYALECKIFWGRGVLHEIIN